MQNTSALYKQIVAADTHWFESKLILNSVEYGESDLFSIETDRQTVDGKPEIGRAISSEISVKMVEPTATIPKMAVIEPHFRAVGLVNDSETAQIVSSIIEMTDVENVGGVLTFDEDSGVYISQTDILTWAADHLVERTSEWLRNGIYFIDTRAHGVGGVNTLTIHGYDAMLKAEQDYPDTNHTWPYLDISVVNEIAQTMGVEIDSRVAEFITAGYMVNLPTGYSMRETLGNIAAAYAGSFVMSPEGKLMFVPVYGLDPDVEGNYLADENGNALVFGNEGWCILV